MHPAAKITRKSQQFILALKFKANFKNSSQILFALYTNFSIVILKLNCRRFLWKASYCDEEAVKTERVSDTNYSGTPPYDHPVYKTTSLLRPYSFKPNVKNIESFSYFEDPVNATTSLLRPGFYGPTVVVLTGSHCIRRYFYAHVC